MTSNALPSPSSKSVHCIRFHSVQMSDERGRIVGTKLNQLEQLSMCMCGSLSHHYHLMHTNINNAVCLFFGMKPEYKKKQKNHSIPICHSIHEIIHTLLWRKFLNLTCPQGKKNYLLHFSCHSKICTVFKKCITSDNISTFVSKYRHSWCLQCGFLSVCLLINATSCQ